MVREIRLDCDADTILLAVEQRGDGAACHEGYESCFFRVLEGGAWRTVDTRQVDPGEVRPRLRPSAARSRPADRTMASMTRFSTSASPRAASSSRPSS